MVTLAPPSWLLPVGSFGRTHLQSFALPVQAAAEPLVVGRQHVQLRPQGVMGRGRGFGDEAVDAVGQQFDLELLGVDLLLRPLVGSGGEIGLFLRLQLMLLISFACFLGLADIVTLRNFKNVIFFWNNLLTWL